MTIRVATKDDATAIQAIYAPIVRDTEISFEDTPPSIGEMSGRIETLLETFPWLVLESGGEVVAYAYAAAHRRRAAYRWSCETSVYVGEAARRTGAARRLYKELFSVLTDLGYANALAGITLPNEPSVGFHEAMGFKLIGVYPNVGFKSGGWRDVGWWNFELQKMANDPKDPIPFSKYRQ